MLDFGFWMEERSDGKAEGLTRRARRERQATDGGRWKRMFCRLRTAAAKGGGLAAGFHDMLAFVKLSDDS